MKAAETTMACGFTNDELSTLSDSLLLAIEHNNRVCEIITDARVQDALCDVSKKYRALNDKICSLMQE